MTTPPTVPLLTPGESPRTGKVWPWFLGAFGFVLLDQVTKLLVRHYLTLGNPVPLIGKSLVRLTYVLNPGIAFGVEILGLRPLLIFGWLAAIILCVYLYRLARRHDILRWPVMLFLAGAMGNSIDRLLFGQVTDFVDVDMPDFIMERFAIFNVADSCITIGIVLLAVIVLFIQKKTEDTVPAIPPATLSSGEEFSNTGFNVQSSSTANPFPPDHDSGSTTRPD